MSLQGSTKCPWNNKFHAPTLAQLREAYPKTTLPVFDAARQALLGLAGVSETIAWHGVPWRWTLVYDGQEVTSTGVRRPFAYLVPDPARLQICIPLTREQVAAMPIKRFKRTLRDAIVHARTVAGVSWPSWDLPTRAALDDVLELIKRKHRLVVDPREAAAVA